MDIIIKENYDQMSKYAAEIIAGYVKSKPNCVLGLATGGTPIGTYKELARMHKEGLDFSQVKTFNLDEYLGEGFDLNKSYDIDQSYARFMHEELFKHINIKKENVHIPDGLTKEPEKFCKWYEEEIKKAGGVDLQLLGLGGDGHWAFNEPGSSLTSRTRIKTLSYDTILANSRFFNGDIKKVPTQALTVGVGTVMDAKEVLIIITGYNKARAVREVVEGGISHMWTVSMLQMHQKAIFVCDEPATMELQVETVKYFNNLENVTQQNLP